MRRIDVLCAATLTLVAACRADAQGGPPEDPPFHESGSILVPRQDGLTGLWLQAAVLEPAAFLIVDESMPGAEPFRDVQTAVVYRSQFPFRFQTILQLPAHFRPTDPETDMQSYDDDPIVPSAGINDRSLRVRDFFRFGVRGTTTEGRELAPGDFVIRPSAVWVYGASESQPILHAEEELHLVWEIDAPAGGGLPPGLYRPYVLYDTRAAAPGSSITRSYLGSNTMQLLVKEAKTEEDRREEALGTIAYEAARDPRRAWDALERASKWFPQSAKFADVRAAFLLHYAEFERLWEELPRIDPLAQDRDNVLHDRSLPVELRLPWGGGMSPAFRPFLKLLVEILQASSVEVALKKTEELHPFLKSNPWCAADLRALIRRHKSWLPKEVTARLEALIAEAEPGMSAKFREGWRQQCAQCEDDIDRLIAAGGLPPPPDGSHHAAPDPHDHPDPNALPDHPGDAPLHPPTGSDRSDGDRAPGAPLLWPAAALLGLAGCVALWALLRNRRRT